MRTGVEFWRPHVAELLRQGRSPQEYASEHGLVASTLKWWRSKLRAEFERGSGRAVAGRFVALQLREAPTQGSAGVMLTVGPEVRLQLPGLPSPQWVAALAQALSEAR